MKNKIIEIANKNGLHNVGFCDFSFVKDNLLNCRAKLRLPNNSKTIILFLFPYKVKEEKPLNISRYSSVPDYHNICNIYLQNIINDLKFQFPKNEFEWFIDNSPIPEVKASAYAGLGVIGENGLLINKEYGSWCFIGEIVTDLKIDTINMTKKCTNCGNCKKACPIGDCKADCLSAVTQQKKDLNDRQIQLLRKYNLIWGCDICADICPLNKNIKYTYIKEFIDGYKNQYNFGECIKNRAFEWRGENVIKRNFLILNGENDK